MDIQWFHTVFDPHGKDMLFGSSCHILQPVRRKSWCGVGMADSMLTGVSFDQRRIYLGLRKINLWIYFLLKKKKNDYSFTGSCKNSWNKLPACVLHSVLMWLSEHCVKGRKLPLV